MLLVLTPCAARAEGPPLPDAEVKRLLALPFLQNKKFVVIDRILPGDGSGGVRLARYYLQDGKSSGEGGLFAAWGGQGDAVMHEADLNGDDIPDLIVEHHIKDGTAQFAFYAGCGNGLLYGLGTSGEVRGGGFTLEGGTKAENGVPWKDIVVTQDVNPELPVRYRFAMTLAEGMAEHQYVWDEGFRLSAMPWKNEKYFKALYIPGDAGGGKLPHAYSCKFEGAGLSSPLRRTDAGDERLSSFERLDLNGDATGDLAALDESGKRRLYAGCGNGWYLEVFDDLRPGDTLGEPLFKTEGLAWRTILRPRPDFGVADMIVYVDKAYMYALPRELAETLAKPVPRWARGLPMVVPYGGDVFVFAKDSVKTVRYLSLIPAAQEEAALKYFPYDAYSAQAYAPFVPITLNSDGHKDYYATLRGSYGSCGSHMHAFLAGIGHGRFVNVGSEYIDDDSIRTSKKQYTEFGGLRWYPITGTVRDGMRAAPVSYPFRPEKKNYFDY